MMAPTARGVDCCAAVHHSAQQQQALCTAPTLQVDTPDSQRRAHSIPETTQRRLEGFCLNTPLTLSQGGGDEVRTLPGMLCTVVVHASLCRS